LGLGAKPFGRAKGDAMGIVKKDQRLWDKLPMANRPITENS
jgi:hypothetical protein